MTVVVHPAVLVNHVLPDSQLFGINVVGTAEVIRIALSEQIKPVTYLSTVAVAIDVDDFVEDGDIRAVSAHRSLGDGYANGYVNSKWAVKCSCVKRTTCANFQSGSSDPT